MADFSANPSKFQGNWVDCPFVGRSADMIFKCDFIEKYNLFIKKKLWNEILDFR